MLPEWESGQTPHSHLVKRGNGNAGFVAMVGFPSTERSSSTGSRDVVESHAILPGTVSFHELARSALDVWGLRVTGDAQLQDIFLLPLFERPDRRLASAGHELLTILNFHPNT